MSLPAVRVVSNYGVTTNGMPYAVAMAKGFFKQQGADVTGILSSDGGGTTVPPPRRCAWLMPATGPGDRGLGPPNRTAG